MTMSIGASVTQGAYLESLVGTGTLGVAGLFFFIALLMFLSGFIIMLTQMHRAWQTVQPAAGLGRGLKIPTPGKAIGFLFIPFYNLYWVFIAFKGLMDAANALKEDRHIPGQPFCSGVATAYAVASVAGSIITPLWPLTGFITCVLLFPIARDVARIINTVR